MQRPRPRQAARAAYVSGLLLILTGGTGAVGLIALGWELARLVAPDLEPAVRPFFVVAFLVAALGGFSVVAGGWLLSRHRLWAGRVFVRLGAGVGLMGLLLDIVFLAATSSDPGLAVVSAALTLRSFALVLAAYAQLVR